MDRHSCTAHGLGALLALLSGACEGKPAFVGSVPPAFVQARCDTGRCFVDPSLDESIVERFAAPSRGAGLTVVYPLDDALHPPNVADLTLQWDPGEPRLEEFHFRWGEGEESFDLYVPCLSVGHESTRGCAYRVPRELWRAAADKLRGRRVPLQLFGLTAGGELLEAPVVHVRFATAPLEGGLTYWSRSGQLHSLMQVTFGAERAAPLLSWPTSDDPNACAGCHAVSRNGGLLAYTLGQGDPDSSIATNAAFDGRLAVVPLDDPDSPLIAPDAPESDSAMSALTSDGARVLTAFDRRLVLRDTQSGAVLQELGPSLFGPNTYAFFPEFSPDDERVVVVLAQDRNQASELPQEIAVKNGVLAILDYDGEQLGEDVRVLVPESDGLFHFYPSWSPDGRWILFVSAPRDDEHDSYAHSAARLRVVSVESGEVYDLSAASGPPTFASTWPKFAPFSQCAGGDEECDADERVYFFSFHSKRDYGYLRQNSLGQDEESILSQLWLGAFEPGLLATRDDPSSPPVWIVYQEVFQRNHQASWSARLACGAGSACGAGASCRSGFCVVDP